jgi:mycofactocin precursor
MIGGAVEVQPDGTALEADVIESPEAPDDQATELLVEEVSIDGLCGVY